MAFMTMKQKRWITMIVVAGIIGIGWGESYVEYDMETSNNAGVQKNLNPFIMYKDYDHDSMEYKWYVLNREGITLFNDYRVDSAAYLKKLKEEGRDQLYPIKQIYMYEPNEYQDFQKEEYVVDWNNQYWGNEPGYKLFYRGGIVNNRPDGWGEVYYEVDERESKKDRGKIRRFIVAHFKNGKIDTYARIRDYLSDEEIEKFGYAVVEMEIDYSKVSKWNSYLAVSNNSVVPRGKESWVWMTAAGPRIEYTSVNGIYVSEEKRKYYINRDDVLEWEETLDNATLVRKFYERGRLVSKVTYDDISANTINNDDMRGELEEYYLDGSLKFRGIGDEHIPAKRVGWGRTFDKGEMWRIVEDGD